ncbi:MAG: tRNA (adenosine(37)-N6)-dimethylallyltransferase MiaA [Muribaculaceae bacterium]|nr:tRNA (adenosine(37)-N6)-dimethylallyltransferase MiaA [Muribaculaceae bacterium]MBQ5509353.1 tRNA (adenosine(37)-N6)-dimethylallyltransferase MiaA [Muribaculaceae bacterium]
MIIITGPTASGKTGKAVALARAIGAEIISADSRQLYRGMDLGTGKDLDEYGNVPYHMIDICPAGYKYNLYEYLRDYQACYDNITSRGKPVVMCGGTGLYVESVVKGIQLPPVPENSELRAELETKSLDELTLILKRYKTLRNNSDIDTPKRAIRAIEIAMYYHNNPHLKAQTEPHPLADAVVIGINIDRDARRQRITRRLKARLEAGMVDEVRHLIESGVAPADLIYYGLEYKFITLHVMGRLSFDEMFTQLETAIHQFAKRQMTWFRGMERRGTHIHWLPYDMPDADFVTAVLNITNSQG